MGEGWLPEQIPSLDWLQRGQKECIRHRSQREGSDLSLGGDGFLSMALILRTKTTKHHIHANLLPYIILRGHDMSQPPLLSLCGSPSKGATRK